jgi:hypothetical protein
VGFLSADWSKKSAKAKILKICDLVSYWRQDLAPHHKLKDGEASDRSTFIGCEVHLACSFICYSQVRGPTFELLTNHFERTRLPLKLKLLDYSCPLPPE